MHAPLAALKALAVAAGVKVGLVGSLLSALQPVVRQHSLQLRVKGAIGILATLHWSGVKEKG